MRKLYRMTSVLVVALVAGIAVPPTAQASLGQCLSERACVWKDVNYAGAFKQNTQRLSLGSDWNNTATSVASYGKTNCARFWDDAGLTGAYIYFSRPARGGTYRDPDLRNGGGYGPHRGENWNDRISSQNWQKCQPA